MCIEIQNFNNKKHFLYNSNNDVLKTILNVKFWAASEKKIYIQEYLVFLTEIKVTIFNMYK